MAHNWVAVALAAAAVAMLSVGVAASTGHIDAPWKSPSASTSHGGHAGERGGHESPAKAGAPGGNGGAHGDEGCGCPMDSGMHAPSKHGGERQAHAGGERHECRGWSANTTSVTGVVVDYDARARVIVVQADNGTNVTVKLAREYVRASDGALVYGGWIAGEAASQGTVSLLVASGCGAAGVAVEVEVGGESYILPQLYGNTS